MKEYSSLVEVLVGITVMQQMKENNRIKKIFLIWIIYVLARKLTFLPDILFFICNPLQLKWKFG